MAESINPVEVKFSADTTGLKDGASVASNSVKEAIDRINTSVVGMGSSITTNTAVSGQALQNMASTVTGALAGVSATMTAVLIPITLVVGAFKALASAVNEAIEDVSETRNLMNTFGMASDEASKLNVSLKLLGITSEEYVSMALKFDRQLRTNEEGLNRMGVTTRDANGELLNQRQLLQNGISTMLDYKAGTDRNAAAMAMFGRSAQEAYKLQRLNDEALERGAETAKKFGLVLSGEAMEGARSYQLKMNELAVVFDSFKNKLGDVLMPVLIKFAELMIQLASAILPAFNVAMKYAGMALDIYAAAMKAWVTIVKTGFEVASIAVKMFAEVAYHALRFDGQVTASWEKGVADMKATILKGATDLKDIGKQLLLDVSPSGKPNETPAMPAGSGKDLSYKGDDKALVSRLPQFEAELAQAKIAFQAENNLRDMSKAQELEYWNGIKNTHRLSKEEMLAIDKQIAGLQLEINRKLLKDQEALTKEQIENYEKEQLGKVKIAEEVLKAEVELGKKTKTEELAAQVDFENQRYAIAMNAQAQRIALAESDPDNPVEKQKQLDKVTQIYQAHQLELGKIQTATVKETVAKNNAMLAPITAAIQGTVMGMLQGTLTLQQGIRNMLQSVLASYVSTLAQMGQKWLAQQMAEFSIAKTFTMLKQALFASSAAATTATKATEATAVVGANAAEGASGAAASVAAIPYVGWAMAAGVFASTMAMILGAKSLISAEGGFDIPAGVNPMAQLHEREMVLPASQADAIRNMASGGGSGAANVSFNVSAIDADGVKRFFSQHKGAIAQTIKDSFRNGTNITLQNKYGRI
jgi:hypothetical protein